MRRKYWFGALAGALLAGACATASPPPTKAMVESRAAVRMAEQSGAQQDPQAAQYLALARQQIAEAERFMNDGSQWSAQKRLEAAQVNAEMAHELARQARARAQAAQAQREIDDLKARVQ